MWTRFFYFKVHFCFNKKDQGKNTRFQNKVSGLLQKSRDKSLQKGVRNFFDFDDDFFIFLTFWLFSWFFDFFLDFLTFFVTFSKCVRDFFKWFNPWQKSFFEILKNRLFGFFCVFVILFGIISEVKSKISIMA